MYAQPDHLSYGQQESLRWLERNHRVLCEMLAVACTSAATTKWCFDLAIEARDHFERLRIPADGPRLRTVRNLPQPKPGEMTL
jgi:hypothetical protein